MPITGTAAGHPNVRATHRKTLELTRDEEIGPRATCVVGVAARIDEGALARLHGRVELTLAAGGLEERVRGRLNPAFQPGDPLVVRRAAAVTRDALVIEADRGAAALARSFVALLADPAARIEVRVEPLADQAAPGVLVAHPPDVVDVVRSIGGQDRPGAVAEALSRGERVEIVADAEGRAAIDAAHDAGHTVIPAPGTALGDAVRAVGALAPEAELVEGVRAEQLPRLLDATGAAKGAVVLDPGTPREEYLPWRRGRRLEIAGARGRRAAFAVEGAAAGAEAAAGGEAGAGGGAAPATLAAARALAASGGSTRDVAQVLRDAGVPRRRAYELALGLTAETSSVSRREPRTSR
jgi:hypothetical protein